MGDVCGFVRSLQRLAFVTQFAGVNVILYSFSLAVAKNND
jgi:hypothetical protein